MIKEFVRCVLRQNQQAGVVKAETIPGSGSVRTPCQWSHDAYPIPLTCVQNAKFRFWMWQRENPTSSLPESPAALTVAMKAANAIGWLRPSCFKNSDPHRDEEATALRAAWS